MLLVLSLLKTAICAFRLSSSFHVEMCYSGVANGTLPSRHIGGLLSGDDLVPEGLAVT